MRIYRVCLAVLALAAAGSSPAAWAQDEAAASAFHATTLDLSAEGEVQATPDLAVISLGVQSDGATAGAALADNRRAMTAALSTLKAQGVAERDIQTSGLSLEPRYADDGKATRRLTGYHVANVVTVRLHDLPRVGGVLDALVAAGANQVDGVSFALADPSAQRDQARLEAVKALQARADLYARAAGYHVARLVHLSEGGPEGVRLGLPMFRVTGARATPVAPGELTVSVVLSAQFELAR